MIDLATTVAVPVASPAHAAQQTRRIGKWQRAYRRISHAGHVKLWKVRGCESGYTYNPIIHSPSGLYHTYYQYDIPTARAAGLGSHARLHRLTRTKEGRYELHVRTFRYGQRHSWVPWPICGRPHVRVVG